jgi:hypothetical protein
VITQTIPDLLVSTRGNMSTVARKLQCQRQTVANYSRDFKAEFHCVVNGVLMTKTKQKGSRA